jgi:hypothetical protein
MGFETPKYLCKCFKDFSIFMSYIPEQAMRMSDAAELATMSRLCQPETAQLMSSLNQFRQAVAWICLLKFKHRADLYGTWNQRWGSVTNLVQIRIR